MTIRHDLRPIALAILATVACARAEPGATTSPSADAQVASTTGTAGLIAVRQSIVVADNLFDFSQTIDPRANAVGNAQNVEFNVRTRLTGCGSVALSGTTVTIELGAGGCMMRDGVTISGSITAAFSQLGPDSVVALTLGNVTVAGASLNGNATFATSDASRFAMTATLVYGGFTTSVGDRGVIVTGSGSAFTIDGAAGTSDGTHNAQLAFHAVADALPNCFPSAGTLGVLREGTSVELVFGASTAATGAATLNSDGMQFATTLAGYGACP